MQIFREKSQLLIEINEKAPFNHLGLMLIDIILGTQITTRNFARQTLLKEKTRSERFSIHKLI